MHLVLMLKCYNDEIPYKYILANKCRRPVARKCYNYVHCKKCSWHYSFFCQIDFNFGPVELNLVSNGNAFVKLVSLTLKSDKNLKSSETTQLSGSILFSHMDLHMSNTLKSHHIYKPVIINITTSQKIRHI